MTDLRAAVRHELAVLVAFVAINALAWLVVTLLSRAGTALIRADHDVAGVVVLLLALDVALAWLAWIGWLIWRDLRRLWRSRRSGRGLS